MNSEALLYKKEDHIATITFNRPENLNALDEEIGQSFKSLLSDINKDKDVRVLILTGAGRAFSSGGNLNMLEERASKSPETNQKELKEFYQTFLDIRKLRIPVIAAINGPAVGAGFCLSLASDLRYASENAKMGANFAKIALAPGMGGTYLITRLAGPVKAAEILLSGKIFKADQAYKLGLLNGIYSAESLLDEVKKIAKEIASNGPVAIEIIKKGIQKAMHASLEEMFDYDSAAQAQCFTTDDIREGVKAIREKRAPQFSGT